MKGKRYTTEEKIRILREEDTGKAIIDICREKNLSEVTFHRWKRQFGHLEVKEARRLKELERENVELKKMLAEIVSAAAIGETDADNFRTIFALRLSPDCRPPAPGRLASWETTGATNASCGRVAGATDPTQTA